MAAMSDDCYANPQARKVNCDEEAWVLMRIRDAVTTALAVRNHTIRRITDGDISDGAIDGIIHGAARSILDALNLEPCYENIRKSVDLRGDRNV